MGRIGEKCVFERIHPLKLGVRALLFGQGVRRRGLGRARVRRRDLGIARRKFGLGCHLGLERLDAIGQREREEDELDRGAHLMRVDRECVGGQCANIFQDVHERPDDKNRPRGQIELCHAGAAPRLQCACAKKNERPLDINEEFQ